MLPPTAKQSDALFRQIKAAASQFGWVVDWNNLESTNTKKPGAWVYNLDPKPSWQSAFWARTFKQCNIYLNEGGKWPGKLSENITADDAIIVINDPQYLAK